PGHARTDPEMKTSTDQEGRFEFQNVKPDTVIITPLPAGELSPKHKRVTLRYGEQRDMGQIRLGARGQVEGTIKRKPENNPIAGVQVILTGEGSFPAMRTDTAGHYQFTGLSEGEYNIALEDLRISSRPVVVKTGETATLDFPLGS